MASTGTYLNFEGNTEEAFNFYRSVFGTEFTGPIMRHGDVPVDEAEGLGDTEKNLVMHVGLPILGGHLLMGTDIFPGMGMSIHQGNNVYICLQPDKRADADRLFAALGDGGKIEEPLQEMFWGDYFGTLADKFGIQWMIVCESKD